MDIPSRLASMARDWAQLKRWERRELGQSLRRLGLSYREIQDVIPVAKGTLSHWCRDICLTKEQLAALGVRGANRLARAQVGAKLRSRNLVRTSAIRTAAQEEAAGLINDPVWVAGVVAYWAEGGKRSNRMLFSNSDFAMVRLFLKWSIRYLKLTEDRFIVRLHLHDGQDEDSLKEAWSCYTGIPLEQFRKSFIKVEGTGHRKNILYGGTAAVHVTRSTDLVHRTLGWIDAIATEPNVLR